MQAEIKNEAIRISTFLKENEGLSANTGNLVENGMLTLVEVAPNDIVQVCNGLKYNRAFLYDMLISVTGIDSRVKHNRFEVVYTLHSVLNQTDAHLVVYLPIDSQNVDRLPQVPSVVSVWLSADWHERETYDFFGIEFTNHPDLRRILLPADWQGWPLRKDYTEQETYHGMPVKWQPEN